MTNHTPIPCSFSQEVQKSFESSMLYYSTQHQIKWVEFSAYPSRLFTGETVLIAAVNMQLMGSPPPEYKLVSVGLRDAYASPQTLEFLAGRHVIFATWSNGQDYDTLAIAVKIEL